MIHLARMEMDPERPQQGHPFCISALQELSSLDFPSSVTFFVGENGSGKSTVLEGLAAAIDLPVTGGASISRDPSLAPARALGRCMRLSWSHRSRRGFFLRAEDFFNFTRRTSELQQEMTEMAEEFSQRFQGYGGRLAAGMARGQASELTRRYDGDLDSRSHGEAFLDLFRSRFVPGGIYLLDEPEAPLSPQRQLVLLSLLHEMVERDAQFIIATHSPILMAYPGATILSFDEQPPQNVEWDEVEHVSLTRDFLHSPQSFLRHLFSRE